MYCSQQINSGTESYRELRNTQRMLMSYWMDWQDVDVMTNHIITLINIRKPHKAHFCLVIAIQLVESFYKILNTHTIT